MWTHVVRRISWMAIKGRNTEDRCDKGQKHLMKLRWTAEDVSYVGSWFLSNQSSRF